MTTANPLSKIGCIRDKHAPVWIWSDQKEIMQSEAPYRHFHAVPEVPTCGKIVRLLDAAVDCEFARPLPSMIAANIASESKVIDRYGRILMNRNNLDLFTRIVIKRLLFEALGLREELRAWLETSCRGAWVSAITGSETHEFH